MKLNPQLTWTVWRDNVTSERYKPGGADLFNIVYHFRLFVFLSLCLSIFISICLYHYLSTSLSISSPMESSHHNLRVARYMQRPHVCFSFSPIAGLSQRPASLGEGKSSVIPAPILQVFQLRPQTLQSREIEISLLKFLTHRI